MEHICADGASTVFLVMFKRIMTLIQIIAPILAIISLTFLVFQMMQKPDDKKIPKKIWNSVLALFIVFIIPTIAKVFINIVIANSAIANCLEPEEQKSLEEGIFTGSKYIALDDEGKTTSIIPDPDKYEYGTPKQESGSGGTIITGPSTGNAVYFLNVGASSDAILVQDEGKYGLIDTGIWGRGSYVVKQLKAFGVRELEFILITHIHGDHIGGYNKVMENFPVKQLFIIADGMTKSYNTSTYRSIVNTAKKRGTYICDAELSSCSNFTLGNISFKLYNNKFQATPGRLSHDNRVRFENANSLVAVATYNGRRVYFAGDIGNYFGYNMESNTARQVGDIDVYKVAHHGYVSFNNHQDALNYLKSDYAVITNTRKPSNVALSRIRKAVGRAVPAYYSAEGTVVMTIDTGGNIKFIK